MRLYLSSFRVGSYPQRLLQLLGQGRRTALVTNALDGVPEPTRRDNLARDVGELEALGLDVTLVDVRTTNAVHQLAGYDLVWGRRGNSFVFRTAFVDTGADSTLT